jgi:hypothetical protein
MDFEGVFLFFFPWLCQESWENDFTFCADTPKPTSLSGALKKKDLPEITFHPKQHRDCGLSQYPSS